MNQDDIDYDGWQLIFEGASHHLENVGYDPEGPWEVEEWEQVVKAAEAHLEGLERTIEELYSENPGEGL